MKKNLLIFAMPLILLLCLSCKNDPEINSPIDLIDDMYDNIPVVVNTENAFTFTIVADNITYSKESNLNFTNDSLVTTITLTNVQARESSFVILDGAGQNLFSESLTESKVIVNTEIEGSIPKKAVISLKDFSGKLTIVVALKNPRKN